MGKFRKFFRNFVPVACEEMKNSVLIKFIAAAFLLLMPLCINAQGIDNLMLDAVLQYEEGNYKEAKDQLKALASASPENDAVLYYLAQCEYRLGETATAINHLSKAVSLDRKNYWYRQWLSLFYAGVGNTTKQIELLEGILADFPDKALNTAGDLAMLYLDAGRLNDALEMVKTVERLTGENEQTVTTRYDILRHLGRDAEAAEALESYTLLEPSAHILSMLGDYYMGDEKDSLALESYMKALEVDPGYIPALLGKGEVYRQRGSNDEYFQVMGEFMESPAVPVSSKSMYIDNAIRSLDRRQLLGLQSEFNGIIAKALNVHPNDSTLLRSAGTYCYFTSQEDSAKDFFRRSADLYPESIGQEVAYLEMLEITRDWAALRDRAEDDYIRMSNSEFLNFASEAAYFQSDNDGIIFYNKIIANDKGARPEVRSNAWGMIGDMYFERGKNGKAFSAYKKALKQNPDNANVLNNYAYYSALKGGCLKKAEKMAARAVELAPDNGNNLDTYGWILHLRKKDAEAKPVFQRAMIHGGKESAVILDHYAEVLFSLKEYDLARMYWIQAKSKNENGEVPDLDERVAKREKSMTGK